MLACPEQYERSFDRRLVAAAGGVAHAGEETPATLGVADVRRWHAAAIHERVPECDVPRLESVELAVEVLPAVLESCPAVRHAPERRERLRCPADARRTADQRRDVLHVRRCRGALGEVLPERVVKPVEGGVGGPPCASGVFGVSSFDQLPGCGNDVVGAAPVRGGKILAKKRSCTARPEEETDTEADREADGDVLDANQSHPPADGLDEVEEHEE